jgi:flavin reductase (DIM6/NTAB) family NADH-FMN oxidoreductase RutF
MSSTEIPSESESYKMKAADEISWKVGSSLPEEIKCEDLVLGSVVPRPTAWISVGDKVALLEGFSLGNHDPPTIMFGATSLPKVMADQLLETKACTLSMATTRETLASLTAAARKGGKSPAKSFAELELCPEPKKDGFPPGVSSSPIIMYCRWLQSVDLGCGERLFFVEAEIIIAKEAGLSKPSEEMTRSREVLAKIDAELIDPIVSLGNSKFASIAGMYSMPRPRKQEDGTWYSTDFNPLPAHLGKAYVGDVEFCYKKDPNLFGYNAIKSIVMPRTIGWLSTYRKEGRVPHLAPYSFFITAGCDQPMIVFSAYRNNNGETKKDAQTDIEDMGCFVWNVANQALAVPMNLSSSELEREGSEFELTGLTPKQSASVDAPFVQESPIRFECEHVKSVSIGNYTCVIGKVLTVTLSKSILTDGSVDVSKLKPIARCGFTDEYALFTKLLS